MYKFILLIRCVQIYICNLLAFVKLMCHFLFVWRHCNERRKRLNLKILPGFRPPLNRSFNMKSCRAIWWFITKNELYGFIILYKTMNVIIYVIRDLHMGYRFIFCLFSISPEPISNTRMFIYFVYCIIGNLLQGSDMEQPLYKHTTSIYDAIGHR